MRTATLLDLRMTTTKLRNVAFTLATIVALAGCRKTAATNADGGSPPAPSAQAVASSDAGPPMRPRTMPDAKARAICLTLFDDKTREEYDVAVPHNVVIEIQALATAMGMRTPLWLERGRDA